MEGEKKGREGSRQKRPKGRQEKTNRITSGERVIAYVGKRKTAQRSRYPSNTERKESKPYKNLQRKIEENRIRSQSFLFELKAS